MSSVNRKTQPVPVFTHEGGRAANIGIKAQLRRSVMACLLWEDQFYQDGVAIADRIRDLVAKSNPVDVAALAIEAREAFKLRHVPLLLARELARNPKARYLLGELVPRIVQRADEISELLSLYWLDQKDAPIAAQLKKGLAASFARFDEYSLSKYNRDKDITLRDVMFLVRPKPANEEQARLFKALADDTLSIPDTWETALSAGANKKVTFERLIAENKLGAMALLRNLRGMTEVGVDRDIIVGALAAMKTDRVLPYRFIAAARYAPQFEPALETAMFKCIAGIEKLPGRTILLVDTSGSMDNALSAKSDLTRIDAACGLGILLREICEDIQIYTFSKKLVEVPARRGFALRDAIKNSQEHRDTYMDQALQGLRYGEGADRIIVISDEQSNSKISNPKTRGYMLNVASYQNGVGYGPWTHIDGFSESCVRYIGECEKGE